MIKKSDVLKPRWIKSSNGINRYNDSYEYRIIENGGPVLQNLINDRLITLGTYLKQTNKIDGTIDKIVESTNSSDKGYNYQSSHKLSFKTQTSIKEFECVMIDNYWEYVDIAGTGPSYRYYTLYAVSNDIKPTLFDYYTTTTKYGAKGLWRSAIVPGWGQFHKHSYLKGGLILGGTAVLAGGIIFTEVTRADYAKKITMTHDKKAMATYANRRNNFALARNICIGATAALYIYNLVDAIVAPGARYVKVQKVDRNGRSYAFAPTVTYEGAPAATMAITF